MTLKDNNTSLFGRDACICSHVVQIPGPHRQGLEKVRKLLLQTNSSQNLLPFLHYQVKSISIVTAAGHFQLDVMKYISL